MTAIQCSGITKSFGTQTVIDDLYLSIREGSVTFLLGLNGAGKTTLLKLISGLLYPDVGDIAYKEKRLGSLIDSPKFYCNLSAYDNLRYHAIVQGINTDNILKALQLVRLDPYNRKPVKHFSLGMKQRLGIAQALMGDYNLVLLDEPFSGLDPAGMEEIRDLIKDINLKTNKTLLISSHLLSESEGITTDYAILHGGKIAAEFSSWKIESACRKITITTTKEKRNYYQELFKEHRDNLFWREKGNDFWIFFLESTSGQIEFFLSVFEKHGSVQIEQSTLKEYFLAVTERGKEHAVCS